MPAGLQVFTASGVIQIDENYQNYMLLQKASISASSLTGPNGERVTGVEVYTSSVSEMVAIRSTALAALHSITPSGAGLRYIFGTAGTVTYYRYGLGVASGQSFGLQIFNAAGKLVFDAASPALRVTSIIQSPDYRNILGDYVWDTSRTYAAMFGFWSGLFRQLVDMDTSPSNPLPFSEDFIKNSPGVLSLAGGLRFQMINYWNTFAGRHNQPPPNKTFDSTRFSALIVDVTGQ